MAQRFKYSAYDHDHQSSELPEPSGGHGGLSITASSEVLTRDPQSKLESSLWLRLRDDASVDKEEVEMDGRWSLTINLRPCAGAVFCQLDTS